MRPRPQTVSALLSGYEEVLVGELGTETHHSQGPELLLPFRLSLLSLAGRSLLSLLPRRTTELLASLLTVFAEVGPVALELLLDELALEGALFVLRAVVLLRPILIVLELSGRELLIVEILDNPDGYLIALVGLIRFLVLLDEVIERNISHSEIIQIQQSRIMRRIYKSTPRVGICCTFLLRNKGKQFT